LVEAFAAGTAMAAAVAEDARRRAEQQKATLKQRRQEWDDAIRSLEEWVAGTDVLLAAVLWTHGFCRNGRGRWRRRARR
jgi:hypothetical protein